MVASTTASAVCQSSRGARVHHLLDAGLLGEFGLGEAGADGGDLHPLGAIFGVQRLAELDHQALGARDRACCRPRPGEKPASEATLMIAPPPRSTMPGMTA